MSLWLIGVTAGIARLIMQWRNVRKRISRLTPIEDERLLNRLHEFCPRMRLRQRVQLLQSEGAGTPFLVGLFRPCIVFPKDVLSQSSYGELEAALAHELAHLKRHDLPWNWLAAVVETLFFFHPMVWLARREWRDSSGKRPVPSVEFAQSLAT